jgi:hypothetical protein
VLLGGGYEVVGSRAGCLTHLTFEKLKSH